MVSDLARLTENAKKQIQEIQAEVQKQSGVRPSEGEVVESILSAIDKQSASELAFEARKKKNKTSKFDELFTL